MTAAVDETPSPPQSPPQSRRPLFGFGEPKETPGGLLSSPLPNPATSPESLTAEQELLEELERDSEADAPLEELEESGSRGRTSSPGSTQVANPLAGAGLQDMARAGVLIAGDQAHRMLARTPGQQTVGLYATDTDDAQAIGDPLARIAGRHQGIGEVSPDTADLLASMMGIARYATKQIGRAADARAIDGGAQPQAEAVDL